jgi:protease I
MAKGLNGKRVAILVTDGFEQDELVGPREGLETAGAFTEIVSPKAHWVKGWKYTDWGDEFPVDRQLSDANPDDYDALLLPGGQMNPDSLRIDKAAVQFVRSMAEEGKPIAAICHGPALLIEAGIVQSRRLTSFPSIQTDLKNAGATWVDEEVVTDEGIVTSRKPDDIPAFNKKMIEEFGEGIHSERSSKTEQSCRPS